MHDKEELIWMFRTCVQERQKNFSILKVSIKNEVLVVSKFWDVAYYDSRGCLLLM